jgi:oligopeptide transport system ATP-binding protein
MSALLEVEALSVRLQTAVGPATVVNEISYSVEPGEVFGIAGESGSGKTMSVLALMGLLPAGARVAGRALFGGRDLLRLPRHELRRINGRELAMVFQDPMTSLHPMLSVGTQLTEHVRRHLGLRRKEADARALELLREVRIPNAEGALEAFPHQFSGGMRQRIAIAIALACGPRLIVADEPTTALDVTVQAGVIRLLDRLRREQGLAIVLITHDLGVLSSIADRVAVFYAGRVVEGGGRADVLGHPRHPYTRGLLDALPHPEAAAQPLVAIPGAPPAPRAVPPGCPFHPRCRWAEPVSREVVPSLRDVGDGRLLACHVDPFRNGGSAGDSPRSAGPVAASE